MVPNAEMEDLVVLENKKLILGFYIFLRYKMSRASLPNVHMNAIVDYLHGHDSLETMLKRIESAKNDDYISGALVCYACFGYPTVTRAIHFYKYMIKNELLSLSFLRSEKRNTTAWNHMPKHFQEIIDEELAKHPK